MVFPMKKTVGPLNSIPFLVLAIFLPELLFTRILGEEETAKIYLMLQAGGQTTAVFFLFVCYASFCINSRGDCVCSFFRVPGRKMSFFLLLFLVNSLLAGIVGFANGHSLSYALGDIYKFTIFPVTVFVIYSCIKSEYSLNFLLKASVLLYAVFMMVYAAQYLAGLLLLQQRPILIYIFPFMPPILFYLHREFGRRSYIALLFMYAVIFIIFLWFSQSLSFLVTNVFVFLATWWFHKGLGQLARKFILGFALTGFTVISVAFLYPAIVSYILRGLVNQDFYLTRKFYFIFSNGLTLQTAELIGGDRVAHFVAVIQYYCEHPSHLLFGQGMGGKIYVESVTGLLNRSWKVWNHFVEGGYPEVLLRSGIIGLFSYMMIFIIVFRQALKRARENIFCAFAAAYALYVLIFSLLNLGYIGNGFGSLYMASLTIAGTLRLAKNKSNSNFFEKSRMTKFFILHRNQKEEGHLEIRLAENGAKEVCSKC